MTRRRFLWSGNKQIQGRKCKVNWSKVCTQTRLEGLGIPDLEKFARALRVRWLWYEWTTPNRPWVGMQTPREETNKALFAAATTDQGGDGQKANFWESTWLTPTSLGIITPNLYRHSMRENGTVEEALKDNKWVDDLRHNLNLELLTEYLAIWEKLLKTSINLSEGIEDTITSNWTTHGEYSTRSAYSAQFLGMINSNFHKIIWKPWAPSRCKLFEWLLLQGRLWTADRLRARGWLNNTHCPFCSREDETVHHLFLTCMVTQSLWAEVAAWTLGQLAND